MLEKLRSFLIKLLGGTTAGELDEIQRHHAERTALLEAQIRRMENRIHVVRAEMVYTEPMRETMLEPVREYMVQNIVRKLTDEVMPMVKISESFGTYTPVYTLTGTLRVYKED